MEGWPFGVLLKQCVGYGLTPHRIARSEDIPRHIQVDVGSFNVADEHRVAHISMVSPRREKTAP